MSKSTSISSFSSEKLKSMLHDMMLIRKFEETLKKLYQQGKIHGTMHLCIGQEATAVGACVPLTKEDKITSTHRGHGHSIAKGTDVKKMMAELLGKESGYCKGKGGSMHIADLDVGNLGANGIVAAGLPLGTGAALTSKMKDLGYVVLCFLEMAQPTRELFMKPLIWLRCGICLLFSFVKTIFMGCPDR